MRGTRHGGGPAVGDEPGQAGADAVVAQRIGQVGGHHGRIVREVLRIEPITHAQVGQDARQRGQQQLLHGAQARIQRGG